MAPLADGDWATWESAARAWEHDPRCRAQRLRALLQSPQPDLRMLGARLCTPEELADLESLLEGLVEKDTYEVLGPENPGGPGAGITIRPVSIAAAQALAEVRRSARRPR